MITFSQLPAITGGQLVRLAADQPIKDLITDSRKAAGSEGGVFFAIRGSHHDGHRFIDELYQKGVRQFIIEDAGTPLPEDVNALVADSAIAALQALVAYHRRGMDAQVIGITGSNGKTIVKEWLFQLLSQDFRIAKNPGSYNSQIGVPLSVWQLRPHHQLGIFEAGISRPGEMEKLARVLQPSIGLFTNIGSAHDQGFSSRGEKISEKLKLFTGVKLLVYCKDHKEIDRAVSESGIPSLTWGFSPTAGIHIRKDGDVHTVSFKGTSLQVSLPFSDKASVENCFHCVALMIYLDYSADDVRERVRHLQSVPMRLELKEGINQTQVIDDSYNNDVAGLQISLDFLANQHQKTNKRLILSDILESGLPEAELAAAIANLVRNYQVDSFVGVGKVLCAHRDRFPPGSQFYETTEALLSEFPWDSLQRESILVKGARPFRFERVIEKLQRKVHGTVMQIDLGALVHNLNFFRDQLRPSTKLMVMVKAFAYGSGASEIANLLQYHKVDYLGVAYADEGVDLRKNNITLPIMVMNPAEETFASLLQYKLEPEIYSFNILQKLLRFLSGKACTVHVKLDTGMRRLGFEDHDLPELVATLCQHQNIRLASIFSHLAGADERQHDSFSREQAERFLRAAEKISAAIGYRPLFHLLNSPGILRLPEFQFDMVRLGIGLYGVDPTHEKGRDLQPVATLKTVISQVKRIRGGETVGYGRTGAAPNDMTIATIAIGYADGFSRAFSRGKGKVSIRGRLAPVIGNVCMDMTMVDISGIDAREGDEVIIFGPELPISEVAASIGTIPYEILTSTSERVKRVFVAESI